MKISKNFKYILIGLILLVGFYFIFKTDKPTDTPSVDADKDGIDDNTGKPTEAQTPFNAAPICYAKKDTWSTANPFSVPNDLGLENTLTEMRNQGWATNKLKYGVLFLKGMNSEIYSGRFELYKSEIEEWSKGNGAKYPITDSIPSILKNENIAIGSLICKPKETSPYSSGSNSGSTSDPSTGGSGNTDIDYQL